MATARVRLAGRIEQLASLSGGRARHGLGAQATLAAFAQAHLVARAESQKFTEQWLAATEKCLGRAIEFFGADRELSSITVADVRRWSAHLLTSPNGRGATMSPGNVRQHLNCLSNLYRLARAERLVPSGYDPVGAVDEEPSPPPLPAHALKLPHPPLSCFASPPHHHPRP